MLGCGSSILIPASHRCCRKSFALRLRCEFLLVWHCSGVVTQVQHLLFSCYYLGSALHAGGRETVAFLVRGMGGGTKTTLILPPHPSHRHPPAHHSSVARTTIQSTHASPGPHHVPPCPTPAPQSLCEASWLPAAARCVAPPGSPFLALLWLCSALAHVYTASPVSQGCAGEAGMGLGARVHGRCGCRTWPVPVLPWSASPELAGPAGPGTQGSLTISAVSA